MLLKRNGVAVWWIFLQASRHVSSELFGERLQVFTERLDGRDMVKELLKADEVLILAALAQSVGRKG